MLMFGVSADMSSATTCTGLNCIGPFEWGVTPGASASGRYTYAEPNFFQLGITGVLTLFGRSASAGWTAGNNEAVRIEGTFTFATDDSRGFAYETLYMSKSGRSKALTDANGPIDPFSSFNFEVIPNSYFGFFIESADGADGMANAVITARVYPTVIPLPAALPLLAGGAAALALVARGRGRKATATPPASA
jgi:hypothetical protein